MATQQEINQQLGVWFADLLKILNASGKGRDSYLDGATQLISWADKYIKPLITSIPTATISLPTVPKTVNIRGKFGGTEKALNIQYANALLKSINGLRAQLPGILNTLQIKNAGEIISAFDKIRISIDSAILKKQQR